MQVIGFNFTKIHAERRPNFKNASRNYNIEFTDLQKEKVDLLKDAEAINLSFSYALIYGEQDKENKSKDKQGEISFEGTIKISATKDESKQFQKAWKKKQIPPQAALPIHNFIFKRCSIKSVALHEELGLHDPHLKIPQLQPQ